MYTIIIRFLIGNAEEEYELVHTDSSADFFIDGKITRLGLAKLLAEPNFEHYTLEQIQDCECVRVFDKNSIKTIAFKEGQCLY